MNLDRLIVPVVSVFTLAMYAALLFGWWFM